MNFFVFFSSFVGHFWPPGFGSGSTDPIETGSDWDPDPDPQPCLEGSFSDHAFLCAAGWGAGVRGAPGEDPHLVGTRFIPEQVSILVCSRLGGRSAGSTW